MGNYNKHILIFGSARSGTSWLAETIAAQHRYRLLFEPEHEYNTKQGKLICDRYINSENSTSEIDKYLKKIFSNRIDNDWIAQCSNRRFKRHLWPLIPMKFIIKFVRCNLSAHYINEKFKVPVIHIIRNPYDVLHSQQRVKFPWLYDLSHFLKQEKFLEIIFKKYKIDLNVLGSFSELQILALRWCLENAIPLEMKSSFHYKAQVLKYEELKTNINLYYDLCKNFDINPIENLDKKYYSPSSKTHTKSSIRKGEDEKLIFTAEEYQDINYILDHFCIMDYERRNS